MKGARWWHAYGEKVEGTRMWRCRECGVTKPPQGRSFQTHLYEYHGVERPKEGGMPEEVEVEVEKMEEVLGGMTREGYKGRLMGFLEDTSIQGAARIAAMKLYGDVEGFLGEPPEKDLEEKEKVWREMHKKAMREMGDVRALLMHELRDPIKRGEISILLEEAEKG